MTTKPLIDAVRAAAYPLTGMAQDYDPLLKLIGDARFVLLGETSHGTHEFYYARTVEPLERTTGHPLDGEHDEAHGDASETFPSGV